MNDFDIFNEKLKEHLRLSGYPVTEERQINYGVMYRTGADAGVIRVYRNKKGKITLDTSAVKDKMLLELLSDFSAEKKKDDILLPPPLIGTDEAGKGDYFSSLIVCGIYADKTSFRELEKMGVKDSKKLSDDKMMEMSGEILRICPDYSLLEFTPQKLNSLHENMNINDILGMAHGKVIAVLHTKTGCPSSLSDKFGNEKLIDNALRHYGISINSLQYPRAEANAAVAAASIIARCKFIKSVNALSEKYDMQFPLGAGESVDRFGHEFAVRYGIRELQNVSKYFFRNTQKILSGF